MSIERIKADLKSVYAPSHGLKIKDGKIRVGKCSECQQFGWVSVAKVYAIYSYSNEETELGKYPLCIDCWKKLAAEINLEELMK